LSGILDWISVLSEVNTDDVKETSQSTGLVNVSRKGDQVEVFNKEAELLNCTPNKVVDGQIAIPNIMK
jgi:aspartyl/glutamyl-tRNA(Asn/Gln) amidotransferase C subunit